MNKYSLFQKSSLEKVRLVSTKCEIKDLYHPLNALNANLTHEIVFLELDEPDKFAIGMDTTMSAVDLEDNREIVNLQSKIMAEYRNLDSKTKLEDFEQIVDLFINQLFLTNRAHIVDLMRQMGANNFSMPFSVKTTEGATKAKKNK